MGAPVLKVNPTKMPKPLMATTSSAEQAAMTKVGMPLATPYPLWDKLIKHGMMTAGDTAAKTNPKLSPTVHGKPRMRLANMATAKASVKQGMNVALMTMELSFIKACGSSSRPAINRITVKQIKRNV